MSRRRLPALALTLAAVFLLPACGQDQEATFKKDFKPVDVKILKLGTDVGSSVRQARTKSDRELQQEFAGLATRTGSLQRQVKRLKPPDKLKSDTNELAGSLGDAEKALSGIEKAASSSDPQGARRAAIQLVAASQTLRSSRRRVAKATGAKL